jgi:hypothetical protein
MTTVLGQIFLRSVRIRDFLQEVFAASPEKEALCRVRIFLPFGKLSHDTNTRLADSSVQYILASRLFAKKKTFSWIIHSKPSSFSVGLAQCNGKGWVLLIIRVNSLFFFLFLLLLFNSLILH